MANLIVRVLLGLEPLSGEAGNVRPEALVKGGLQLNIDAVLECRPVVPAVHGHDGVAFILVSCDQRLESNRIESVCRVRSCGRAKRASRRMR